MIPENWTEASPGGLICNPAPDGGIIDNAIVDGKWFVIFNDDRDPLEGFESREEAIKAFSA